jgi:hypothetical protein
MNSAFDQFERQLVAASRELSSQQALAAPTSTTTDTDDGRRRTKRGFVPKRLLLALAATIVAAGGVAAASSILSPTQRLADGLVNCFMATHGTGAMGRTTLAVGDATANGQPPISFCRMWYRLNDYHLNGSPPAAKVADLPLIACQENPTTVGVYVATGRADQCQRLGEKPLPKAYADASARLRDLQRALVQLQSHVDCPSVASLAEQARAVLADQGFSHWRVITPPSNTAAPRPGLIPAGTGGTCGTLIGNGVAINTQRQTVSIILVPPRTISRAVNRVMNQLAAQTFQRCYTPTSIRPIAQHDFANTPLRPRFAFTARRQGEYFSPTLTERLYAQGCVYVANGFPGNDNRFIDILLYDRNAPRPPAAGAGILPTSAFRP